MAYTKTNWQNSPSTATPLNATNLNKIENGLFDQDARITTNANDIDKLENVVKYITATAGSDGDFYIDITNTLATDMIIYVNFPTATTLTANARFSIDNGVTYKNIFIRGAQALAREVSNLKKQLIYDGTQFIINENTVKSIITGKFSSYSSPQVKLTEYTKIGSGLGINANGDIEVLSDNIRYVLVSGNGFAYNSTVGTEAISLLKNTTIIGYNVAYGNYRTAAITPVLVPVVKGDYFRLTQENPPTFTNGITPFVTVQEV